MLKDSVSGTDDQGRSYHEVDLGDGKTFRLTSVNDDEFECSIRTPEVDFPLPPMKKESVNQLVTTLWRGRSAWEKDTQGNKENKEKLERERNLYEETEILNRKNLRATLDAKMLERDKDREERRGKELTKMLKNMVEKEDNDVDWDMTRHWANRVKDAVKNYSDKPVLLAQILAMENPSVSQKIQVRIIKKCEREYKERKKSWTVPINLHEPFRGFESSGGAGGEVLLIAGDSGCSEGVEGPEPGIGGCTVEQEEKIRKKKEHIKLLDQYVEGAMLASMCGKRP